MDNAIDELYVFFSIYDKKEKFSDVKFNHDAETSFFESNFMFAILDMLRPHISEQAGLFSSCLSLLNNGNTGFRYQDLESFQIFEKNRNRLLTEGSTSLSKSSAISSAEGILSNPKDFSDPMSFAMAFFGQLLNPTEMPSKSSAETATISEYEAVLSENTIHTSKTLNFATIFYRNVAPALVRLDHFYVQENAAHAENAIVDTQEESAALSQKKKKKKKKKPMAITNDTTDNDTTDVVNVDSFGATDALPATTSKSLAINEPAIEAGVSSTIGAGASINVVNVDAVKNPNPSITPENKVTSIDAIPYVFDHDAYKTDVRYLESQAEKHAAVNISEIPTIADNSWIEELRVCGTSKREFDSITHKVETAVGGKMLIQGNNFMFLFHSPRDNKIEAITGDVPHGAQLTKRWPAWKKSFLKVLGRHGFISET